MSDTNNVFSPRPKIAIIGGGISGLSAAWHAQKQGFDVELFEAQNRLGGVLGTIHWEGRLIEGAADNFATMDDEAIRWCRELGLDQHFIPPEKDHRRAMVLFRGRPIPIPGGFSLVQPTRIWPIITTPILSWLGKLRLLSEYFFPKRDSTEDESLQDFACRRLGRETFVRLVEPIVGGIFTADPQKLSMQATLPQFVEMEREHGGLIKGWFAQRRKNRKNPKTTGRRTTIEQQASGARYAQFLAPKAGMSWWIEGIAKQLTATKIHLNSRVKSLKRNREQGEAGSVGRWSVELGTGDVKSFDAVVIATPSKAAGDLLQPSFADVGELIGRFRAASSAVAVMILRKQDIAKMAWCFGIVVPAIENRKVLAISFTSLKYPGRVQEDEILVRLFLGGAMHPEMLNLSRAQLIEVASEELREIIGWEGKAVWSDVIRWESAMPQYDVGHLQQVELIEKLLEAHDPTIRLAGATYRGVGVPQCIRSGRKAVEALQAILQPK